MTRSTLVSFLATAVTLALASPAGAQTPPVPEGDIGRLETVVVTAEKRSESVQAAPLAVTAVSTLALEKARILNSEDLAHSQVGLSFTQNSPQALEYNIRGVVNTRLTAPTADQSVSIFTDEVYVARSGSISSNYYDLERVEVVRGPQGVLLGKNVAGGAINIISAKPSFENSGAFTFTGGNYDLKQVTGFVTGGLNDEWAGRLAFQTLDHGGYAYDLMHHVELEDLHSQQVRGQLRYDRKDSSFRANLLVEYAKDNSNGPNRVGVASPAAALLTPNLHAWSTGRAQIIANYLPGLSIRESFPTWPTFAGDVTPTPQQVFHENVTGILKLDGDVAQGIKLTSVTGYRHGRANTFYDQTGLGPTNPYYPAVNPFGLFAEPVYFHESVDQYSEELRLTSNYTDSRVDWIAGVYWQQIKVHQFNRFWGESSYAFLDVLTGESHWDDPGKNEDYAAFGQLGFKLADAWKLDVGVRYTHDKKSGVQTGIPVSLNSKYDPNGKLPLTPLGVTTTFVAPYGQSWTKTTPQGTITFKPRESLMAYLTVSEGYKGGGFQNDATNAVGAAIAYQPETVTNYELGLKLEFLDGRARWNTAAFYEDYKNLQVQQTVGSCACNVIANAKKAEIKGVETEFQISPVRALYLFINGTWLDDKYKDFIDPNTKVNYAGRKLQRTPAYSASAGGELTTSVGSWPDALHFRLSYKYQDKIYWTQTNFTSEPGYGLLDGRISLAPKGSRWDVSVWGKNITDKVYRTNTIEIFGDEGGSSYGIPRTFGADLSVKF
jgi:iron complex outermembrane recepter protein